EQRGAIIPRSNMTSQKRLRPEVPGFKGEGVVHAWKSESSAVPSGYVQAGNGSLPSNLRHSQK
ncbi:MAG: hypothetical protein WA384_11090, partial [Rhodomicrobium sp.]